MKTYSEYQLLLLAGGGAQGTGRCMWDCRDLVVALKRLHTIARARSRVLGLSACLVQAANAMPGSSSCLVKGLPCSPHPSILQVLVHE